jgi:hypothetical protein
MCEQATTTRVGVMGNNWDSFIKRKTVGQAFRDAREAKKMARIPGFGELKALVEAKQRELDRRTQRQIKNGHKIKHPPIVVEGTFGDQLAVVKFFESGDANRVDIFYGGAGNNPLDTPEEAYHGHVILKGGLVDSWLEPGPKNERNRLY